MKDQVVSDLFFLLGLAHHAHNRTNRVVYVTTMRHDKAIIQILDSGEIPLILLSVHIGNILDPFLIWLTG